MRLYRGKFESWLKAKPHDEIVGENRDCHSCPIANFYHEASGGCEVVIFDSGDGYYIDRGYSEKPLPWWSSRFIFSVDGDATGKISAGRALEIMGEIAR
jgi:hypothetical protein